MARLKAVAENQIDALLRVAPDFDLLHFHLLSGEEMARFSSLGIPTVCTVHNSQPGWPRNLVSSGAGKVDLLAACSLDVEHELRDAGLTVSIRTVWNGIEPGRFDPGVCRPTSVAGWRKKWGFASHDIVLLAIANPRPQKRLHLSACNIGEGSGKASPWRATGPAGLRGRIFGTGIRRSRKRASDTDEVERLSLAEHVRWTGSAENVPTLLATVDVLISASAYEGLSLTHWKLWRWGFPLFALPTAGTFETSFQNPLHDGALPVDSTPDAFAEAIARALTHDMKSGRSLGGSETFLQNGWRNGISGFTRS